MKTITSVHPRDQVFVSEKVPGNLKNRTFQLVTCILHSVPDALPNCKFQLEFGAPIQFRHIGLGDLFVFTVEGATPDFLDMQVYSALSGVGEGRDGSLTILSMRVFHTSILRGIYEVWRPQSLPIE